MCSRDRPSLWEDRYLAPDMQKAEALIAIGKLDQFLSLPLDHEL